MFPVIFHIGPLTLHTYGLLVAIGFLSGIYVMRREFDREGIPGYMVDRLALTLMLSGIVGARILYFGVNNFQDLKMDPWSFFRIWEGGLVFYGGFIAALIAVAFFAVKNEIPFFSLTDSLAAPLFLGQAIGRLGCFAAGCCYGKPTESWFGVVFTHPESLAPKFARIYPTQIFSSLGDFVLFGLALFIGKKNPAQGVLTSFYLIGYGVFRFFIEFVRGDDRGFFAKGLSPSQWLALLLIVAGIALAVYVKRDQRS